MLKVFFWLLLLANVALFGMNRSAADAQAGREPSRLAAQLQPERIILRQAGGNRPENGATADAGGTAQSPSSRMQPQPEEAAAPAPNSPASQAAPVSAPPAPGAPSPNVPSVTQAPSPTAQQGPVASAACLEVGEFGPADAARFETRLASLGLGARLVRQQVRAVTGYIVFLPSQGSQEAAAQKAQELQGLGVTDYFIFREGVLQWAISLGIFQNEQAARSHLAMLTQRGVQSARIAARRTAVNRFTFQIRDADPDLRTQIEAVKNEFGTQQLRACTPAQADPLIIANRQS